MRRRTLSCISTCFLLALLLQVISLLVTQICSLSLFSWVAWAEEAACASWETTCSPQLLQQSSPRRRHCICTYCSFKAGLTCQLTLVGQGPLHQARQARVWEWGLSGVPLAWVVACKRNDTLVTLWQGQGVGLYAAARGLGHATADSSHLHAQTGTVKIGRVHVQAGHPLEACRLLPERSSQGSYKYL